jgi:hypothetical protein
MSERRAVERARIQRTTQRLSKLSAPITPERIATFVRHLVAVSFGAGEECWLYVGCGKGTTLPEDLSFKADLYAQMKFNGETVGPHQFALAASQRITLADLAGFDTHHASEFGRCLGYRCVNPDHLEQIPSKVHAGSGGKRGTVAPRHTKMVREVLSVPTTERRPVEQQTLTGAGSRRRFLAGIPFLIRGGVVEPEKPTKVTEFVDEAAT